jgi:hypothetical protein
VKVLPKGDLPALIVEAPPNTCSNAIELEGIIPGAWINIEVDGGPLLLRQQARHGTSDVFVLPGINPLPASKSLNVWQEFGDPKDNTVLQAGPKVSTGPIQNLGLKNPLKSVTYCSTPMTCSNKICMDNFVTGRY